MNVLFVCAGNTCRSPMAEAIARHAAGESRLALNIGSAGIDAHDGDRATEHAIAVSARHGGDLGDHCARRLTPELVDASDAIFVMTRAQLGVVESRGGGGKTRMLDEAHDVEDPLCRPLGAYEQTYDRLAAAIPIALARLTGATG